MKQCNKCKVILPEENFYWNRVLNKYNYTCKKCAQSELTKRQRTRNTNAFWTHKKHSIKNRALKRGLSFNLSTLELKLLFKARKCFYCKDNLNKLKSFDITIDRIDNSLGYSYSNCVIACRSCNSIKANIFNGEETKFLIKAIKLFKKRNPTLNLRFKAWISRKFITF